MSTNEDGHTLCFLCNLAFDDGETAAPIGDDVAHPECIATGSTLAGEVEEEVHGAPIFWEGGVNLRDLMPDCPLRTRLARREDDAAAEDRFDRRSMPEG